MAYSRCPQPSDTHKIAISSIVSIAEKRERSFSREDAQHQTSVSLKSGPGCGNFNFEIHVSSEFNYQKPPSFPLLLQQKSILSDCLWHTVIKRH